jgi:hypothetical protein
MKPGSMALGQDIRSLLRLVRRSPGQQWLVLEAAATLLTVKIMLLFVPFARWRTLLRTEEDYPSAASLESRVVDIVWSVERVSSRFPMSLTCLPRALAVRSMMARRRLHGTLSIGVSRRDRGRFEAHAWIEFRGKVIIGDMPDLARFARLPGLSPRLKP